VSELSFWKMHGAGNDFILFDDRKQTFPADNTSWLAAVAARRTGIGCEGIILIQPADQADFRMRFFNPDGNEVAMCGNGARCVARLAHDIGAAPESMTIDTVAGVLKADVLTDQVRLTMSPPGDWRLDESLSVNGTQLRYGFVNSGVPHVVVEVEDLKSWDVHAVGKAIRYHDAFAPDGTNANFIHVTADNALDIRTYERGVEAETLACGTGIVAAALVAGKTGRVRQPVAVSTAGGYLLTVGFTLTDRSAEDVTLLGPAEYVCTGNVPGP
jgi:diaminopimelate epimerase